MLVQKAIEAALKGDWAGACKLNEKILKENPQDFEALNRLAYAQAKLGKTEKALKTYRKLLRLDPYNPIARKNFAKLKKPKAKKTKSQKPETSNQKPVTSNQPPATSHQQPVSPSLFLAEGEKIKSVDLLNIAEKKILRNLLVGEEVTVSRRGFELQVKSKKGVYLGTFPDDVGRNLLNLLKKKVKLRVFLQDIRENRLTVFIKWTP